MLCQKFLSHLFFSDFIDKIRFTKTDSLTNLNQSEELLKEFENNIFICTKVSIIPC